MFTDTVGFTTAAQRDEAAALRALEEQEGIVRPLLSRFHGRDVKSTGDGFLAEFDSALHAVECAVAIAEALRERNERPGVSRIELRIGVHLGDVEERNGDIFGDAVNIAARIEPLAVPGGICISGPVFDQVRNKLPHRFEKLPPTPLKHVETPVDVYRVRASGMPPEEPTSASARRHRLAVLPLANISPDPKDEYFADGLTEELISALSKIRGLRVIARTSVSQYKSTAKPVSQIGAELEVASVLEGSVRKAGNRLRITLQLIDVQSQEHLWAHSYDRELDDVFRVQSEVAEETAKGLRVELVAPERESLRAAPTANMSAYTLYLQGLHAMHSLETPRIREAIDLLEEATRRDPEFSLAHAAAGNAYLYLVGSAMSPVEAFPPALHHVARALELDPNSTEAHAARGNLALQYELDWDLADRELRLAISLNPSNAEAHWWLAVLFRTLQRFDEAEQEMARVTEMDPLWDTGHLGLIQVYVNADRLDAAERLIRERLASRGENLVLQGYLAAILAFEGRGDEARSELARLPATPEPPLEENIALVRARLGDSAPAERIAARLEAESLRHYVSPVKIAVFHAILGRTDRALDYLERDYESGGRGLWFFYLDPIAEPLWEEPRFRALLRRMRLPDPPRRRGRATSGPTHEPRGVTPPGAAGPGDSERPPR
jgi:adenylate cyclase